MAQRATLNNGLSEESGPEKMGNEATGRNRKHLQLPEQDNDLVTRGNNTDLEIPLSPLQLSHVEASIESPGILNNSLNGTTSLNNSSGMATIRLNNSFSGTPINGNRTSVNLDNSFSGTSLNLNNSFSGNTGCLSSSFNGNPRGMSYSYNNGSQINLNNSFNGNSATGGSEEQSKERGGSSRVKHKVEDCKPLLDDSSSINFDLESTQIQSDEVNNKNVTPNTDHKPENLKPETDKEPDICVTELDNAVNENKEEECNIKTKSVSRPDSGNTVDSLYVADSGGQKDGGDGSPRSPRPSFRGTLHGYLEPIMPGYTAPIQSSLVIKRTVEVEQHVTDQDSNLRDAIPIMPRTVAVCCFLLNVVIPGSGTLVSGLSVLCCSRPRRKEDTKSSTLWTNCVVALLQLITVFIFLLGWVWSILWGTIFIQFSQEYNRIEDDISQGAPSRRESEATPGSSTRTNNRVTTRTTTTTSISLPGTSDHIDTQHSIIVLQEAPVIVQAEGQDDISDLVGPQRTLNPYNPRHQRILRRQRSEDDIRPMLLNPHAIENMVINNVPVPHHLAGGRPADKQQ